MSILETLTQTMITTAMGLVVFLPFMFLRRRLQERQRAGLASGGAQANATVVEVWREGLAWSVTYEFQPTESRSVVRRTETYEHVAWVPFEVGATIEVAYSAEPPFVSSPVWKPHN